MIAKPLILNQRRCDIYFRSTGRVDINATIVKAIGLQDGDVINLTMVNGELYLYATGKNPFNPNMRFRNAVHPSKKRSRHFRCQSKILTDYVNNMSGTRESWFFVGKAKDLSVYGINSIGVPIIYKNNQYNNGKKDNCG